MLRVIAAFLLTALLPAAAQTPGPAAGATAPDFTARDQNGREWTRQSLSGPKGLMLVFYRSADW